MSEDVDEEEIDLDSPFIHVWDERDDAPPWFWRALLIGAVAGEAAERIVLEPVVAYLASIESLSKIVEGILDAILGFGSGLWNWFWRPSIVPADLVMVFVILFIALTILSMPIRRF